jgi:ATP-dependent Lon protease
MSNMMNSKGRPSMASNPAIKRKQYALNEKIKRAQKLLGTKSETETIERALDEAISDHEAQRRAWAATERFIKCSMTYTRDSSVRDTPQ